MRLVMCGSAAVGGSALCAAVWSAVCGSVQQCVRQCAAVRAAVCGSAHDSVHAVRTIVCCSALGSIWQCVRQCARLSGSAAVRLVLYGSARGSAVRLCGSVTVYGSVRRCVCGSLAVCSSAAVACSMWQCARLSEIVRAAACGSVCQCVAVGGSASARRNRCVAVRVTYIYTKSLTIHFPLQEQWK
jgi:hypothetical protein